MASERLPIRSATIKAERLTDKINSTKNMQGIGRYAFPIISLFIVFILAVALLEVGDVLPAPPPTIARILSHLRRNSPMKWSFPALVTLTILLLVDVSEDDMHALCAFASASYTGQPLDSGFTKTLAATKTTVPFLPLPSVPRTHTLPGAARLLRPWLLHRRFIFYRRYLFD